MEYFFLWLIVGAIGGAIIGSFKGRVAESAVAGMILGVFGWALMIILPSDGRQCPSCRGIVPDGATKCKHCGDPLVHPVQAELVAPVAKGPEPVIECERVAVRCPVCGEKNMADEVELTKGMRCSQCGIGFVPKPTAVNLHIH